MGVAAYNRGSAAISRQISEQSRPAEFQLMDDLNALPKYEDAGHPFGTIHFEYDRQRKIWWAICPVKGFGFWYKTLREAVRRFHVHIVGYDNGVFIAKPYTQAEVLKIKLENIEKRWVREQSGVRS